MSLPKDLRRSVFVVDLHHADLPVDDRESSNREIGVVEFKWSHLRVEDLLRAVVADTSPAQRMKTPAASASGVFFCL